MVHLGPFLVHQRLGRGGMGEVWAGHHVAQDIPVAIKVLSGTERRTENFIAAFRMEVRAAAALEHPSIVAVLDQGLVGVDAEVASGGHFIAGTPYLVMERVGSDTLSSWAGRMPWEQLRASLLEILSALAHAHARGVLHRDIKPGNVLCDPAGGDLRVSDFGLARITERDHAVVASRSGAPSETLTGTPAYMAPEQFDAEGRDIGPWSDLYAVGCLAWTLVTGAPPFGRPAPAAAMAAHLHRALPPLTPRMRVPEGLESWLRHLLEKDPADRPAFAADAADALRRVDGPLRAAVPPPLAPARFGALPADTEGGTTDPEAGRPPPSPGAPSAGGVDGAAGRPAEQTDTLPVDVAARARATAAGTDPEVTVPLGGGPAHEPSAPSVSRRSLSFGVLPVLQRANRARGPLPAPMPRASLPARWEEVVPASRPRTVFLDAGLGLFGVRATALVGRQAERDALWEAIRKAQEGASIVIVRGPVGSGKTRLAEWAGEVAHASGAAQVLRVLHAREPSARDGLAPALLRALHGEGLDQESLVARIAARLVGGEGGLEPDEAQTLATLLAPGGTGSESHGPSTTPRERQTALVRLLERLSRERPLVALVENAQWGRDVVALARDILRSAPALPVLFLLVTGDDDDLGADMHAGTPGVRVVDVPPLDAAEHAGLVRELLGLAPGLADQVAARTAGHPLFAVQLVGDWVARGLLRPGPEGFELRAGATPDLPDDLHALWARQVDEVVAGRPDWEVAIEAAAVLGAEVENRHLAAVVRCLDSGSVQGWGGGGSTPLRNASPGVATPDKRGSRGVPQLASRSEAGALRGPTAPPHDSHETIRGLVEALFRARLAAPPLADGLVDWRFAHAMLRESLLRRVVEGGRAHPLHAACAEVLAGVTGAEEHRAWHLVHAGRPAEAVPLFEVAAGRRADAGETAAALALVAAWEGALQGAGVAPEVGAWAAPALRRAEIAVAEGGLGQAQAQFSALVTRAHANGWTRVEAVALLREAVIWRDRGVPARAEACVERARTLIREDDPALRAQYLYVMGRALRMRGDGVGAERALLEAVAIYDTLGNARDAALCCDSLGGIAVQALRLDDAWRWAEAALARATAAAMRSGIAEARVMFGEVERLRGNLAAAEGHYRDALALARVASPTTVTFAWANLGLVLLLLGRWSEAEPYIRDALRDFEAQGRTFFAGAMQVGLLSCAAARGDFAAWDAHLASAEASLHATGFHDVDVAISAELAAREAGARGEVVRARGAWRIARDQRRALGHVAEAEAAAREMGAGS